MNREEQRERLKKLKLDMLQLINEYCWESGHDLKVEANSVWVPVDNMTKKERAEMAESSPDMSAETGLYRIGVKLDSGLEL